MGRRRLSIPEEEHRRAKQRQKKLMEMGIVKDLRDCYVDIRLEDGALVDPWLKKSKGDKEGWPFGLGLR